jgi:hypothetical protein
MTLTIIAARLREVAAHIDALPLDNRESDVPDELVPKPVMNAFVDEKLVEAFLQGWSCDFLGVSTCGGSGARSSQAPVLT